jgi:3-oxoacyl-[acyl-carrier-protein] synthase II
MGLVTPLGKNVSENWDHLKAMKTGIAEYPVEGLPKFLQFMGKVKDPETGGDIPHKLLGQMKFLNRGSLLGFFAAREAVSVSGANILYTEPGRRALFIASGDTTKVGYDFMYPATKDGTHGRWRTIDTERLNRSTLNKVNPFFLLESINNNLFSFLSAYLEFMGPNTSLASHSPCGGNALELAWRSIMQGNADIAMAIGCGNWITEIPLYELDGLGLLSHCREGARSFRPFDRKRDGFIGGEGGAAIFLESSESAKKRGARVFAKIKGFGNNTAFLNDRGISVHPHVTLDSMVSALNDAACELSDLAFVIPHGSGSQKGDRSELNSIKEVFGNDSSVPVCGLKPYTGHLGAASDIAEVIFGIKSIEDNIVPATLNFRESEREFSDLKISGAHQDSMGDLFLSVSYGIGGQSSTVVTQVLP